MIHIMSYIINLSLHYQIRVTLIHFFFISDNEVIITTNIDVSNTTSCRDIVFPVKMIFHIGKEYPNQFPQISILSENLDRDVISRVKSKVLHNCSDLLGEPILISLILSIKENLQAEIESESEVADKVLCNFQKNTKNDNYTSDKIWTSVLHIDHMRSKTRYCKTLEKWASELTLCGKILFCNKLIIVILQGNIENIKVR